ncbi:MAG: ABC transporter substrate-binding protein [Fodinibius sp.]|nr:ABC transporter substrate-binding protein [Fodinibius sp.]
MLAIEWMEPLMAAGNWVPQLIQLAGGEPLAAETGQHSPWLEWDQVRRYNPDIITIIPCGYTLDKTLSEVDELTARTGWSELRAVQNKQVYLMDGHHYFNRPGPRLVESTQLLAEVLHPSIFRNDERAGGWLNLWRHQFENQII